MKKIICILMAVAMIAATCFVLTGCGDDKKTDPTKATVAATQPATQAVTNAPVQTVTEAPAQSVTAAPQATQGQDQPQSDVYGGITGTEAAEQALAYAGEGYQVVSNEQRYLRNQEAWYVGVQALVNDSTVYHIYINADGITPESEIPDRSGDQSGYWGGITLDTAVEYARAYLGEGWNITGSEQSEYNGAECWWIHAESEDGGSRILYVNSDGVIGEAV